ncbi:hypothetical protein D9619_002736 [Psilocybe cf. subviscida]|uniref:Rsm22-domain-containing protein n=1 Tax=Psilocybe cf. subviscida TaxID=2480587 RepID=A0A8H5EUK1_9AGAR|nr:hypothetical protein D9619_002736 [Psilocybe cf. subviscida]
MLLRQASKKAPKCLVSSSKCLAISSARLSTSAQRAGPSNEPLKLDPSYQQLFKDVHISLQKAKISPPKKKDLQIVNEQAQTQLLDMSADDWTTMHPDADTILEEESGSREARKSPAAAFGSKHIGTVVFPLELQMAINQLVAAGEKSELRSDATRLFTAQGTNGERESDWDSQYDKVYRSRQQTARHSVRDGTAFATIALPAHYSAITAVLENVKHRIGPDWTIDNVIDFGAGTGSGLWASVYAFQNKQFKADDDAKHKIALDTTIKFYKGIDKRAGLVSIGEIIVGNADVGNLKTEWKKSFKETDILLKDDGPTTLALSAFMLSSLPNTVAQKTMVEEMWNSGAHTIILIDHNTEEGFEAVAHAREYLLKLGRAEIEEPETAMWDTRGAHVVAPCPHDGACPLLTSGGASLVCGYVQRSQRPDFLRKTKHTGVGHEDIGYSYVVIQRGPRPPRQDTSVGRIGVIGRRELEKEIEAKIPMKELAVHVEGSVQEPESGVIYPPSVLEYEGSTLNDEEMQAQLRKEAYQWPRLVFTPLKKSGHIILDSCTAEGKIMRLTIPKSQGKQPFYDARKSSWGDIFPHAPKNAPLERNQPKTRGLKNPAAIVTGGDIGKRKDHFKNKERVSYLKVADEVRASKKRSKREFALTRGAKVWSD